MLGICGKLCCKSRSVEKALGLSEKQSSEGKYLQVLAETYQHATSWDTRRQVLAIFADLASFREIRDTESGETVHKD